GSVTKFLFFQAEEGLRAFHVTGVQTCALRICTNNTVIAALAVSRGEADAMLCGVEGRYMSHLRHVREIIGFLPGVSDYAALALIDRKSVVEGRRGELGRRHRRRKSAGGKGRQG